MIRARDVADATHAPSRLTRVAVVELQERRGCIRDASSRTSRQSHVVRHLDLMLEAIGQIGVDDERDVPSAGFPFDDRRCAAGQAAELQGERLTQWTQVARLHDDPRVAGPSQMAGVQRDRRRPRDESRIRLGLLGVRHGEGYDHTS